MSRPQRLELRWTPPGQTVSKVILQITPAGRAFMGPLTPEELAAMGAGPVALDGLHGDESVDLVKLAATVEVLLRSTLVLCSELAKVRTDLAHARQDVDTLRSR